MNTIVAENFEYRHKKFDQSERSRSNSWSSSCTRGSEEFSYIKVNSERIEKSASAAIQQSVMEATAALNLFSEERNIKRTFTTMQQEDSHLLPVNNRLHLEAFYPALNISSASCLPVAATAPNATFLPAKKINLKKTYTALQQEDLHLLPATKRLKSESCSPALSLFSPIPLTVDNTAAAVIPPTTAILPKINHETLRSICKYHGNMVRKFPKKERTPKDQERRNKNTIACRMSRRVKKLEHLAIEEQYKEFTRETFNIIEKTMRATAYLHELMKLTTTDCPTTPVKPVDNLNKKLEVSSSSSASAQEKKPFTIAFLTGND